MAGRGGEESLLLGDQVAWRNKRKVRQTVPAGPREIEEVTLRVPSALPGDSVFTLKLEAVAKSGQGFYCFDLAIPIK